jgi:hypothetical protein
VFGNCIVTFGSFQFLEVGWDGFLYSCFSAAGVAGDWKTRELLLNDDFGWDGFLYSCFSAGGVDRKTGELLLNDDFELAKISFLYEAFT